jgi:hypothetical protein
MSRKSISKLLSDRNMGRAGLVMGALALFMSLGGNALAEDLLKKLKGNSVNSKTIVNNSIKSKDIRKNGVQTSDVKDGTLIKSDLAASIRDELGVPGPAGPVGPPGPSTPQTIEDGSITNVKIGPSAVSTTKILDGTILASDIATNAVGALEIAPDAVGTSEVDDGTISAADLAANSVSSSEVLNGSLTGDDIGRTSGTVSLNFPEITNGDCEALTFNAPVAVDGDVLVVTPEASFAPFFRVYAEPDGGTGVRVTACNFFGADGNPGAADFAYIAIDV